MCDFKDSILSYKRYCFYFENTCFVEKRINMDRLAWNLQYIFRYDHENAKALCSRN